MSRNRSRGENYPETFARKADTKKKAGFSRRPKAEWIHWQIKWKKVMQAPYTYNSRNTVSSTPVSILNQCLFSEPGCSWNNYYCRLRVPTKGNGWSIYGGKTKTTVSLPRECDLECSRHELVLLKQVQIQGLLVNSTENADSTSHCSRFFLLRDKVSQAERLVEVCALYLCKSCKRLIIQASSIAARPLQYKNVLLSHIYTLNCCTVCRETSYVYSDEYDFFACIYARINEMRYFSTAIQWQASD